MRCHKVQRGRRFMQNNRSVALLSSKNNVHYRTYMIASIHWVKLAFHFTHKYLQVCAIAHLISWYVAAVEHINEKSQLKSARVNIVHTECSNTLLFCYNIRSNLQTRACLQTGWSTHCANKNNVGSVLSHFNSIGTLPYLQVRIPYYESWQNVCYFAGCSWP